MNKSLDRIITTADNYIDTQLPQTPEAIRRRKNRLLKPLAVTAIGIGVLGGAKAFEAATSTPEFSSETFSYTVEQGDGIWDAAREIDGINTIDTRDAVDYIAGLPENEVVLEDGLQPGEQLTVPLSVER